ncbi:hypothetical protein DAI22_05g029900 [Oryza sativa Japonica Group]|nr:hypothetical protein DAI22_05g029900 [Oryza sativa Japonica Group]
MNKRHIADSSMQRHIHISLPLHPEICLGSHSSRTYAISLLFWAEIYCQAHAMSNDGLGPPFLLDQCCVVYAIQVMYCIIFSCWTR